MPPRRRLFAAISVLFALALPACSTSGKAKLVESALSAQEGRKEYLEAVLRVLDKHPEYVDELFADAQRHPKTLDRFIGNAARHLDQTDLAKMTAQHLARNPAGLREILVQTLEASKDDPEARKAIASAIDEKSDIAAAVITDDNATLRDALEKTIYHVLRKPAARKAFLGALRKQSPALAELIVHDPETLKTFVHAMVEVGADEAREALRELVLGPPSGRRRK